MRSRFGALALATAANACSYAALPDVTPTTGPYRDEKLAGTCKPDSAYPILDLTGVVMGGLYVVYGAALIPDDEDQEAAGVLIGLGVLMAIPYYFSARHGFRSLDGCEAERARPSPLPPGPPSSAENFHQSARNLAAQGNCAAVRDLVDRIADFDPAYYAASVADDPAMTACFAP